MTTNVIKRYRKRKYVYIKFFCLNQIIKLLFLAFLKENMKNILFFFCQIKNAIKRVHNNKGVFLICSKKKSPTLLRIFYSKEIEDYLLLSLILAFLPVSSLK